MLIIIALIVFTFVVVGAIAGEYEGGEICFCIACILGIVLFIVGCCTFTSYANGTGNVNHYNKEYETICYKINDPKYINKEGSLTGDLVKEIEDYNNTVKQAQIMTHDSAVGNLISNKWDKLKLIELKYDIKAVNKTEKSNSNE